MIGVEVRLDDEWQTEGIQPEDPSNVSEVAESRTSSRRGLHPLVVVGITLLVVGGSAIAGVKIWSWWTDTPWTELRTSLQTFPVPDGFTSERIVVSGDRPAMCDLKPGCDHPRANLSGSTTLSSNEACDRFTAALAAWPGATAAQPDAVTWCYWEIEVDGHPGQAYLGAYPGSPGVQWNIVIWP